jgi:catechol 2,3-dioxygenase-like lactoylglutathione lyase family enzyme
VTQTNPRQGETPTAGDRVSRLSRRGLLQWLGVALVGSPVAAIAQGRCMRTFGIPACNTSPIPEVFETTGWKTVALDHVTFQVADCQAEAAFYAALMGWTPRSSDSAQVVLDIGAWGTVIFKQVPAASFETASGQGGGRGGPVHARVETCAYVIAPWNAARVEADLRKRGLTPIADNHGAFESFHVKDPDGFDLQLCNGEGLAKGRGSSQAHAGLSVPPPFASTGWKTVWLDHFSFNVSNYKESVSFYRNLLGWQGTYDEGSQNELMIGEIGDIIVRGPNPLDPAFAKSTARGGAGRIDHISFGIQPWDTDGVKAELEKRGLKAQVDTSTGDEIHVAAFKSYHTTTPNGYNLQISYVTHDNRLALPNAVKPKPSADR